MENCHNVVTSTYQKIAVSIANDIVVGKYEVGEKLSGRSTLAGAYGVSPETIRRAAYILKDLDIIEITKGSGIVILSAENAKQFISKFAESESFVQMTDNIKQMIKTQRKEQDEMYKSILKLLDVTKKKSDMYPFTPYTLHINSSMDNVGKTIADVNFWQNTGATIVAIKRGKNLILSPGPYAEFKENDIIYFIGDSNSVLRVETMFTEN